MDSIFKTIKCSETDKCRLAIFQLTYAAADWWESKIATLGDDVIRRMNWTTFCERFLGKYFPEVEKNKKEK